MKYENKRKKLRGTPKDNIEKIIENFNFKIPSELPTISSIISGYFSYDTIRYIEKIPNTTKNDLKIPDARILRPKNLIVFDNAEKKLFFIVNCFSDEKIKNYPAKYDQIQKEIEDMIFLANYNYKINQSKTKVAKPKVKSNISKKKFLSNVSKAKNYIKIGDIFQVVLSQRFETDLNKEPINIYKKINGKKIKSVEVLVKLED